MTNQAQYQKSGAEVVRVDFAPITEEQKKLARDTKLMFAAIVDHLQSLPPSRERSIALTKVEEASMWAVKGITG